MKKYIISLIFLLCAGAATSQTATPMAQYAGNQMIFNPGFAGAHDLFSANLSLKTLWVGIPNSPKLISLNMHAPFVDQRNALGFIFQRETFGPQTVNLINFTYAYKIHVSRESFFSLGVQAGLLNSVTDWDMIEYVRDWDDPALGEGREQTNGFDMGVGLYFQARDFYMGLSVRHLTTPKFDEVRIEETGVTVHSKIRRQIFLIAGYNITLNPEFDLRPRMFMRYKYGMPLTVSTGVDFVYDNRFFVGASFTTGQSSVTLSAAAEIFEGLRIGYAFDMNFGVLRPFQRGSHEILISYFIPVWNRTNDVRIRRNWQ